MSEFWLKVELSVVYSGKMHMLGFYISLLSFCFEEWKMCRNVEIWAGGCWTKYNSSLYAFHDFEDGKQFMHNLLNNFYLL